MYKFTKTLYKNSSTFLLFAVPLLLVVAFNAPNSSLTPSNDLLAHSINVDSSISAPTNLTIPSPTNAPALSWTGSANATSYNIYRDGTEIGSTVTTTYTDNTASAGSSYSYYVTAVDNSVESEASNVVNGVLIQGGTQTPTIQVTASPAANGAGWNNGPVTLVIKCGEIGRGNGANCDSSDTVTTEGADQTVTETATDYAGNTASVTVTLNIDETAPTVGTASWTTNPILPGQSSTLTVPASDSLSGVVGGEYYIGTTDPGQGSGTAMTWNGTDLSASIGSNLGSGTYQVNVRSEDAAGNWSSVVSTNLVVGSSTSIPSAPTGLTIPSPTSAPALSWNTSVGAVSYNVYRNGAKIGSSLTTTYTDTTAVAGNTYSYYVTAVDTAGESPASNTVNATVITPIPAAPTNLTIPSPTNAPALSWTGSTNATSYNIYRNGTKIGSTTNTTYTDTTATNGTPSYYVTAVDTAGESPASNTVNASVNTTPPNISYIVSSPANGTGWNNSAVTVTFYCNAAPNRAGITIASCTAPVTLTTEGADQVVTGTAVDTAGNTASVTVTLNIDETAPTVGTASWTTNPILPGQSSTLTVPASDSLSGVVGGEYYIGTTDPGQGSGTAMTWNGTDLSASIGSNLGSGTYQVNVRSEDAAGNWSSVVSTNLVVGSSTSIPSAPTGLTIPSPTSAPALSWNTSVGAVSYNVYRNGAKIGSSLTTTYTDTTAVAGNTYSYYVTAVDTAGESPASNTVNATVITPIPAAPTNLTIPSPTNAPALSWTGSTNATSYNIYRNGTKIGSTTNTTYTDTTATNGTPSYYVTAVDTAGESPASNTVNASVNTTPPNISYIVSSPANGTGWNNSAVTVTFYCNAAPNRAGITIASCTAPVTLTTEGADQVVTGTAVDTAGNTASVTVTLNIDETAPTVGTASWTTNPILPGQSSTLTVPASDSLSGVVGGEYYIGTTDPGQGSGTAMTWNGTDLSASIGSNLGSGTYQVNVRSEDAAGNWSSVVSTNLVVGSSTSIPSAPTGLTIPSPTSAPALSWNTSVGAVSYNVYRNGAKIGSSLTTTYTDTTAVAGNTYSYYVTAVDTAGESPDSNTINVAVIPPIPSAPTGLTIPSPTSAPALSWNTSVGATSYNIYRNGTKIGSSLTTTYTDTTAVAGNTYSYYVTAVDTAGESPDSNTINVAVIPPIPSAPTGLSATSPAVTPALSWTGSTNATSYNIYRNGTKIGSSLTTTYTDTTAVAGNTYSYYVTAVDTEGESPDSNTINVAVIPPIPSAPTGLSATSPAVTPALSWTGSTNAVSYNIYRNGTKIGSSLTTTYTDTTAVAGNTYSYYVTAVDTEGESPDSNTINVAVIPPIPSAPTGLSATSPAVTPALSWTGSTNAVSYNIYRNGTKIGSSLTTTYTDTTAVAGNTYSYYVTAVDTEGESPDSNTINVAVIPPIPSAPTGLSATSPAVTPALSWTGSTNAVSYNIYRNGTKIGSSLTTTYTDTTAVAGNTYSYYVTAVDTEGESPDSNTINVAVIPPIPSAPTGLSATSPAVTPALSWTGSTNAVSYNIYRNGTKIGSSLTTTYTDTTAVAGNTYSYYVTAVDTEGESPDSNTINVAVIPPIPSAPTGLSATSPAVTPALSWTGSTNAVSYNIYRNGTKIGSSLTTTYTDTTAVAGNTYSYYVTAVDTEGESPDSNTINVAVIPPIPSAPTGLSATSPAVTPALSWTGSTNAVSYNIYRNGTKIGSSLTTTYTDTTAVAGNTYSYYVTAVDTEGESPDSNTINVAVIPPIPSAPTGLSATSPAVTPALSWTGSTNAVSYNIYRNGTKIGSSLTTTYTDTTAVAGNTYSYYVTAVDTEGESPDSNTINVAVIPPIPSAPTGLSATSPAVTPALSWTGSTNATSYNIYRNGTKIGSSLTTTYTDTTAVAGNTYSYYVTAVDTAGSSKPSNTVSVTVYSIPVITSSASYTIDAQVPVSFNITTTGYPTASISESGALPAGLTFTNNGNGTATISGAANISKSQKYSLVITATSTAGKVTQNFTLTVNYVTSAPVITSPNSATAIYNSPFNFTVSASGVPYPTFSLLSASSIPSGLNIKVNGNGTVTVTGTPTGADDNGVYTFTIGATNSVGTVRQTFTLYIDRAPSFASIPSQTAIVGKQFTQTIYTSEGYPYPSLKVTGLPSGLSYVDNGNGTVKISGTPLKGSGGVYTITITAFNSLGSTTQSYSLIVYEAPTITSTSLTTMTIGTATHFQVTASGYNAPVFILGGTLPAGISFNCTTGVFSGTPKAGTAGTYKLTLIAVNSEGTSATQSFTLTVIK